MGMRGNLEALNEKIEKAALISGRRREDIKLVAVTKTVNVVKIKEAIDIGITSIGENRVQELMDKYVGLKDYELDWHMVGHLQRNKVKHVIDKVSLIHSVDTIALAEEISKRARRIKREIDVLIQINVSGEDSKFGAEPGKAHELVQRAGSLNNVNIKGLMVIAPFTDNAEEVRPVFAKSKEIFEDLKSRGYEGVDMEYLSMGMTGDFEVAIEEGANIVRIGTGIFGQRG